MFSEGLERDRCHENGLMHFFVSQNLLYVFLSGSDHEIMTIIVEPNREDFSLQFTPKISYIWFSKIVLRNHQSF